MTAPSSCPCVQCGHDVTPNTDDILRFTCGRTPTTTSTSRRPAVTNNPSATGGSPLVALTPVEVALLASVASRVGWGLDVATSTEEQTVLRSVAEKLRLSLPPDQRWLAGA